MNGSIAAALRGTGSSVPDRVVPNDWFTNHVDTSDEWIRTRTGIRERRFAGPGETSATLADRPPPGNALAAAGLTADDIDLIVCATVTPGPHVPVDGLPHPGGARLPADPGLRPLGRLHRVPLRPVGRRAVRPHRVGPTTSWSSGPRC